MEERGIDVVIQRHQAPSGDGVADRGVVDDEEVELLGQRVDRMIREGLEGAGRPLNLDPRLPLGPRRGGSSNPPDPSVVVPGDPAEDDVVGQ